jgi:hypothetical protein
MELVCADAASATSEKNTASFVFIISVPFVTARDDEGFQDVCRIY